MPGPKKASLPPSQLALRAAVRLADEDSDEDCFSHNASVLSSYDYVCANGTGYDGSAGSGFHYAYMPDCGKGTNEFTVIIGGPPPESPASPKSDSLPDLPDCFPDHRCSSTDKCDDECCEMNHYSASWVNLLTREYQDEVEDLTVELPGGKAAVVRQFYRNAWHWSERARTLQFTVVTNDSIVRNLVSYKALGADGAVFAYARPHLQAGGRIPVGEQERGLGVVRRHRTASVVRTAGDDGPQLPVRFRWATGRTDRLKGASHFAL